MQRQSDYQEEARFVYSGCDAALCFESVFCLPCLCSKVADNVNDVETFHQRTMMDDRLRMDRIDPRSHNHAYLSTYSHMRDDHYNNDQITSACSSPCCSGVRCNAKYFCLTLLLPLVGGCGVAHEILLEPMVKTINDWSLAYLGRFDGTGRIEHYTVRSAVMCCGCVVAPVMMETCRTCVCDEYCSRAVYDVYEGFMLFVGCVPIYVFDVTLFAACSGPHRVSQIVNRLRQRQLFDGGVCLLRPSPRTYSRQFASRRVVLMARDRSNARSSWRKCFAVWRIWATTVKFIPAASESWVQPNDLSERISRKLGAAFVSYVPLSDLLDGGGSPGEAKVVLPSSLRVVVRDDSSTKNASPRRMLEEML
jgi:hypothetical protein